MDICNRAESCNQKSVLKSQSMNGSVCRNGEVVVSAVELSQYFSDGETLALIQNVKLATPN